MYEKVLIESHVVILIRFIKTIPLGILMRSIRTTRCLCRERSNEQMYVKVLVKNHECMLIYLNRADHHLCRYRSEGQREHIAPVLETASALQASTKTNSFLTITFPNAEIGYPPLASNDKSAPIVFGTILPTLSNAYTRLAETLS